MVLTQRMLQVGEPAGQLQHVDTEKLLFQVDNSGHMCLKPMRTLADLPCELFHGTGWRQAFLQGMNALAGAGFKCLAQAMQLCKTLGRAL
jgi:hypothetical protein